MGVGAGPWYIDDTLTFTVNTHTVTTGAATDADAVPSYRIYEDETGTAILTGNTAKLDDASTVGFYSEQITLSAANGFEVGKSYSIYVAATVNSVAATQSFNYKVIASVSAAPTAASIADAVWDEAQADHVAAGSFGVTASEIADILVDTAEIGAAGAGLTNINLPNQTMDIVGSITGNLTGSVGSVTGAVGSVTGNVGGNVTGSVGSVAAGGITASSIAADAIGASELAADAATEIATAVWATATRSLTVLDEDSTTLDLDATIRAAIGMAAADLDTQLASFATDAEIADAVWDELLAGHAVAGSTGEALSAAGTAGDPWTTALPGAYGAGTAGKIIGDNINAPIGTVDTVVDAIKAKTDSLTFTVANQVDTNIKSVAGTTVTGVGSEADPWGP